MKKITFPKISVIIPVFNSDKTLENCLKSVTNQTYQNYEIIIVNNNSSDNSLQIINKFQKANKNVKLFSEKKQSIGAARNTGEKKANGKVVLMVDSDCVVPRNWVKNMAEPILNKECDATQGSQSLMVDNFWSNQIQRRYLQKENYSYKEAIGLIDTKNFAISSATLKSLGYTNRNYPVGNDLDLSIRFQMNNSKLIFLKDVKVQHLHPDSFKTIVHKKFNRGYWCSRITKHYQNFLNNTDFSRRTAQTFWSFIKFFPGLIKTMFTKGFGYAYFDLIEGLSWRTGILYGKFN
ncbi:glycosyltransferase family 2 protein [Candidatus Woesearchaeota archaeon]|nr:glycosyltransferase family 2 protein [Candidatus Woesearchaeota archaeon]